jgi:hypothetical protein
MRRCLATIFIFALLAVFVPGSVSAGERFFMYYLKNGDEAYRIMRLYSLGITNTDLGEIPEDEILRL